MKIFIAKPALIFSPGKIFVIRFFEKNKIFFWWKNIF